MRGQGRGVGPAVHSVWTDRKFGDDFTGVTKGLVEGPIGVLTKQGHSAKRNLVV